MTRSYPLLSLRPDHEEEDHDHILCNGRPVLIVEYGEVDAAGNGVNRLGPRDVAALLRAVNRAHTKAMDEQLRLRGEEAGIGLSERRRAERAEAKLARRRKAARHAR